MPETKKIVINTSPIIALAAAIGDLTFLSSLYEEILVPFEVCQEIRVGGKHGFAVSEFEAATFLKKHRSALNISSFLNNSLYRGEAAVIQLALDKKIKTVCIDETAGRRIARLSGLAITGSIGILVRARKEGLSFSMQTAIERMQKRGIRLSALVIKFALAQTGAI